MANNHNGDAFALEKVTVNGIETAFLVGGDGPPLVFLHGASTATGFGFAASWTKRFKVYCPYHPGFGESADDTSISEMHDYVLHYLDLFDRLGLRKFHLAGHSMGGWMAVAFAVEQSHRIERLALVAPAGLLVKESPTADIFKILPTELGAYLVADVGILGRLMPAAPDIDFLAARYRESTSVARVAWTSMFDRKLPRWLHRVSVPTLLVWGGKDRIVPAAQAPVWAKLIAGATTAISPNVGHLVLEEDPAMVERIIAFLEAKRID
ncbi:MAG: alpha/beta hydrolase [Rhodospirillales bacterium]|nr:alpha/beta hydrolase [Rhodospirillales bacterium]